MLDWAGALKATVAKLPYAEKDDLARELVQAGWSEDEAVSLVQAAVFYEADKLAEAAAARARLGG